MFCLYFFYIFSKIILTLKIIFFKFVYFVENFSLLKRILKLLLKFIRKIVNVLSAIINKFLKFWENFVKEIKLFPNLKTVDILQNQFFLL